MTTRKKRDLAERFWAKVDKSGECWLWTAARQWPDGYGLFYFEGRMVGAHRVAYELSVGPIPEGSTIDHVRSRGCVHTHCVRPAHLEPVTMRENLLRGDTLPARNAAKTHCDRGHELAGENLRLRTRGHRVERTCRKCRALRQRGYAKESV